MTALGAQRGRRPLRSPPATTLAARVGAHSAAWSSVSRAVADDPEPSGSTARRRGVAGAPTPCRSSQMAS